MKSSRFTVKRYTFTLPVQDGITRNITTTAPNCISARKQVADAENCPLWAVKPFRVTKHYVKACISQGYSDDQIYRFVAGNLGLFAVAFFGHEGLDGDKARLNRAWNQIVRYSQTKQA